MKLFIKHFDTSVFEKKLEHLKHIDFSLFIDDTPQNNSQLSDINILVLQEPNEYFGLHDYAIINQKIFNVIYTWNYKLLNICNNTFPLFFGSTWIKPEHYNIEYDKKLQVSHLCGILNKTYGHSLRHELLFREFEILTDTKFYRTYGDRFNMDTVSQDKVDVFGNSMYGVAIENSNTHNYFTEKLTDLFLLKTIPIYWGCSNIGDFFDVEGIIQVQNVDDIIKKANKLDINYYNERKEVINKNWLMAKDYLDYEKRIVNKIEELFIYNNLI
jgi:hypothetical protein